MSLAPFISPDDLEALMGESLANPTALIVAIALDAACQSVRTCIGQDVNLVTDDIEVHSGSGRRKMRLRQRPVRSVSEVKVDGTVVSATLYNVRDAIISYTGSDVWSFGNDNIYVKYTHGWDVAEPTTFPVPADIRFVALVVARRVYESVGFVQSGSVGGVLTGETIGDYSYTLSEAATGEVSAASTLTEAEMYALDRYRVDLIGDTPTV